MKRIVKGFSCVLLALVMSVGQAAVIDFEGKSGFAGTDGAFFDIDEYRFTLTNVSSGFLTVTSQNNLIESNTRKLFAANHSILTMSRVDGDLFDLLSLDIAGSWIDPGLWNRWADAVTISSGASSIVATLLGQPAAYQLIAPNFLGVSSVVFRPSGSRTPNDFEFIIDNVSARAAVPEPATLALLGLGLAGMAALRRRKQ